MTRVQTKLSLEFSNIRSRSPWKTGFHNNCHWSGKINYISREGKYDLLCVWPRQWHVSILKELGVVCVRPLAYALRLIRSLNPPVVHLGKVNNGNKTKSKWSFSSSKPILVDVAGWRSSPNSSTSAWVSVVWIVTLKSDWVELKISNCETWN